ncbi:hypothetical protein [Streptomyces sp. gCLA4]|uniref:hypothetical protein n=1 Tax=Streptomyces sp. gCLA4 TaxID=1873416 RepID=UPI0015FEDAF5|nr:hypothetical protein [Streptomyces sp. gCLA4]
MLQRTVRTAAALAHDDADFLDRLRDAGLRVRERHGEDGTLVGYAGALPGDRADRGSRPVWFSGSTLAYALSLPRVRERFTPHDAPADWALAETRIREASALLVRAGQAGGAGDVAALGDLLAVAAKHAPALVRDRVRAAVDAFEQAARAPGAPLAGGPRPRRMAGVWRARWSMLRVPAAAAWHRAQEHRAQLPASRPRRKPRSAPIASRLHRPGWRGVSGDGSRTRTPRAGLAGVDGPGTGGLAGAVGPGPDRCPGPAADWCPRPRGGRATSAWCGRTSF